MRTRNACFVLPGLLWLGLTMAAAPGAVPVAQEGLLARQNAKDSSLYVLDLRTAEEFAAGHIPGARNIPHDQVAQRLAELPKDKDLVLYCRTGRRTGIAAAVLAANGYTRIEHLEGDFSAWLARGLPVEKPAGSRPYSRGNRNLRPRKPSTTPSRVISSTCGPSCKVSPSRYFRELMKAKRSVGTLEYT